MKQAFSYWVMITTLSLMWLLIGFGIGWTKRGTFNDKELKIAAKEEFTKALSWAVNNNLVTINSNEVSKLEANAANNMIEAEDAPDFGVPAEKND